MRISHITLLGTEFPLCFSLSAAEEIEEKLGSLSDLGEVIVTNGSPNVKAVDTMLMILMEAGQRYCKAAGIECPPPLPCRPADVIDLSDPAAVNAIFAAVSNGKEREVEAVSKNGKTTLGK